MTNCLTHSIMESSQILHGLTNVTFLGPCLVNSRPHKRDSRYKFLKPVSHKICTPIDPSSAQQRRRDNLIRTSAAGFPTVAATNSWMIALGLVSVAVAGSCLWWIRRFMKADADLRLLGLSKPEPGYFEGKVVWITGASQGLGMEMAHYFSEQGAKLVLSSRKRDQLQKVADSCKGIHARDTVILPFDLESIGEALSEVAKTALAVNNNHGPDYIILNAGGSQHSIAVETKSSVAERLISLNSIGPIALTQELLPGLHDQNKCHIVVVSSMAAVIPSAGQAIYAASKCALNGYFLSLRSEMADSGIKVTVCCPGPIATGSNEQPRVIFGADGILKNHVQTGAPGKRMRVERAVELISRAIRHNLPICWIVQHPILLMAYALRYLPRLAWKKLEQIGPPRAKLVKAGDGYSFNKSFFSANQTSE